MIQPLASCSVYHLFEWRWYQPLRIDISTSTFTSWCFATFTSVYRINLFALTTFTRGDDINLYALIFHKSYFEIVKIRNYPLNGPVTFARLMFIYETLVMAKITYKANLKTHWTIVFIANDKELDFIVILVIASCLICSLPDVGIPKILILKFNEEDLQYVYKIFFCVFYGIVWISFDRKAFPLLIKPS